MQNPFKKVLATVLSILCTALSVTHLPQDKISAEVYYGDANADGNVNEDDVIMLQQYFTGKSEATPDLFAADMNDDSITDIWDIIYLKRFLTYGIMPGETTEPTEPTDTDEQARAYAMEVVELVNKQRAENGLAPVEFNEDLFGAAMIRAEEITEVWGHARPDGSEFQTILDEMGYTYMWCGENIAAGSSTPEAVVQQWMDSPGHKANILNQNASQLGVGCIYVPDSIYRYYWVQIFTS